MGKPKVVINASGNALTKAVTAAEVIKRRFSGLHQITALGSVEIVDEYEPLEEGLEKVTDTRTVSTIEITLSKDALDTANKGYQPPIDESLVKEYDADEMARGRGRGRGGGRGKGRGKGKGRGRGKGKGRGKSKGKSRSPSSSPKGRGKARVKIVRQLAKGRAKEKARGKIPQKAKVKA